MATLPLTILQKMPFRTADLKNHIPVYFAQLLHIAESPGRAVYRPGAAFFRSFLAEQKRTYSISEVKNDYRQ